MYFNSTLTAVAPTAATKITSMMMLGKYVSANSAETLGTLAWPRHTPTTTAIVDDRGMYLWEAGSTTEVERPSTAEPMYMRVLRAARSAPAVNCSDPINITRALTEQSRAPEHRRRKGRTRGMR